VISPGLIDRLCLGHYQQRGPLLIRSCKCRTGKPFSEPFRHLSYWLFSRAPVVRTVILVSQSISITLENWSHRTARPVYWCCGWDMLIQLRDVGWYQLLYHFRGDVYHCWRACLLSEPLRQKTRCGSHYVGGAWWAQLKKCLNHPPTPPLRITLGRSSLKQHEALAGRNLQLSVLLTNRSRPITWAIYPRSNGHRSLVMQRLALLHINSPWVPRTFSPVGNQPLWKVSRSCLTPGKHSQAKVCTGLLLTLSTWTNR